MRSEAQFLAEYAKSHQNPTNQVVHMICVPLIFMATLGMLWFIPLGWLVPGLAPEVAPLVNVATVGSLLAMLFYAHLSAWSLVTGVVWLALSFAAIFAMQSAEWPQFTVCAAVWVAAWAGQFWGHKVEGMKPSFADDLVFLLIGPLFVQQKLQRGR